MEHHSIIGKLITPINRRKFKNIVDKYKGDFAAKKLRCWEQFISLLLGQISGCTSLRQIEDTIKYHPSQQYHLGLRKSVSRSTLSDANNRRDWRIYKDVFCMLMENLQEQERFEAGHIVDLIDSTPIMLKLNDFPWREETPHVKGLKMHVMLCDTTGFPVLFNITGARTDDQKHAWSWDIKSGHTYVFDRGYGDYNWWFHIDQQDAFFVTRLKKDARITTISSGYCCGNILEDSTFFLSNRCPRAGKINLYADKPLRKIVVVREGKTPLVLVTNDFERSAEEISRLYKRRWQIELFFKWIKQNLKIKTFLGRSENAVKTQICVAMIAFVLLRLTRIICKVCKDIPLKTLVTIARNSLFSRLIIRTKQQKYSKNQNQLQFKLFDSS